MVVYCVYPNCKDLAYYNYEGECTKFCKNHKFEGMIIVHSNFCIHPNCTHYSAYNLPNEKPKYCSIHKKEDMIDLKNKRCIHQDCTNAASYNLPNEKAILCRLHKKEDMIDVKNKRCIHPTCLKRPLFNISNKKGGVYCDEHKLDNMVDVVTKRCIQSGCNKLPYYNVPNQKPLYCDEHKLDNMIIVNAKRYCCKDGCTQTPKYNAPHKTGGLYCNEHKKMFMVNVVERPCITPLCSSFGFKKYEGHCLYCFVHLFPHSPHTRNYKTKEASVAEFVKTTFPQYTWIMDKRVQDGCSRRRPDLLLELGDQVLIVEVDENQHMDYDCSCENKRLMELSQDVGHRPLVFIRFNPDSYVAGGRKVPSCWHLNKDGLCVINHKPDWDIRLNALKQQIDYWIHERTTKTVEVVQLFY